MSGDITQILRGWEANKDLAIEQLTPLVYKDRYMPTALIIEA